jgi:glyoxylate carboligase
LALSKQPDGEHTMTANVGGIDKILRIVAGAGLIGATAAGLLPVWGYIGIVPLATGLMGWCPFYPLLGMNTCPMKK